jgi:hypothetical protein
MEVNVMPTLNEWDIQELETVRAREARYRELADQLLAVVKDDTLMPEAEFAEMHQLERALAGDVTTLLSMVERLRGDR